jgi:hypothetical protein
VTFRKGQSGNPAGRRPGTGQTARLREQIAKRIPKILDELVSKAEGGDVPAAKLLLERTLPPLRPETRPPQGPAPTDPAGILRAVGEGRLPLDQAETLMSLATAAARVSELGEIQARLERLEALLSGKG